MSEIRNETVRVDRRLSSAAPRSGRCATTTKAACVPLTLSPLMTAMSARRQASTTSLSRYARAGSPDFANRSLDYCNAFWGLGDGGVEVLFARMRGAMRTMEELRNFWKER